MLADREIPFALIVEDHPLVAASIGDCIRECDAGLELETAESIAAASRLLAQRPRPAFVVTDLSLPDSRGAEAVRSLRKLAPDSPVLVVTALDDPALRSAAKEFGAVGYILKTTSLNLLRAEICAAIRGAGGRRLAAAVRGGALEELLTAKQIVVLEELAAGRSNKEIAVRLSISDETVGSHMKQILGRLAVRNRTEAVIRYFQLTVRPHDRPKS